MLNVLIIGVAFVRWKKATERKIVSENEDNHFVRIANPD